MSKWLGQVWSEHVGSSLIMHTLQACLNISYLFSLKIWHLSKWESGQGVYLSSSDIIIPPVQTLFFPSNISSWLWHAWVPHGRCYVSFPKENQIPVSFLHPLTFTSRKRSLQFHMIICAKHKQPCSMWVSNCFLCETHKCREVATKQVHHHHWKQGFYAEPIDNCSLHSKGNQVAALELSES